jgi:glucosamine 6-phosphate synthetase-like amidotransferase/phosphosugar isomerase protein
MGRGEESTGLAEIDGVSVTLIKKAEPADKFVKRIKSIHHITIGHTRYATTGAITAKNAHPFNSGDITGAHNGIVSNHLTIDAKVEVDSEVIFKLIDQVGFEKAFKKLSGSFAIVWHDTKLPDSINLVRSGNPLYLAKSELGYIWSSEKHDLLSHLVGLKYKLIPINENIVYTIGAGGIDKTAVKFKHEAYYQTYGKDAYATPSKVSDYEGGYSNRDIVWDIANNEGCSLCGAVCDHEASESVDGFIYCRECREYAEQPITNYKFT